LQSGNDVLGLADDARRGSAVRQCDRHEEGSIVYDTDADADTTVHVGASRQLAFDALDQVRPTTANARVRLDDHTRAITLRSQRLGRAQAHHQGHEGGGRGWVV
jgi:hypothetical protein